MACVQFEPDEAPAGGTWDWDYSQQDSDPSYWDRTDDEELSDELE